MKTFASILGTCLLAAISSTSLAAPVTLNFNDGVRYWAGWGNGTSDDSRNSIGTPDVKGGSLVFDNGFLKSVTINFENTDSLGGYPLAAGDLFINTQADSDWDYVVTSSGTIYRFDNNFAMSNSTAYLFSNALPNYSIRENHPIAYNTASNLGTLVGSASVSPFDTSLGNRTMTFSGLNLGVDYDDFGLGWTVSCANDVLYDTVSPPPATVPEPASLMLLGSGLLGLAGFRKKTRKTEPTA